MTRAAVAFDHPEPTWTHIHVVVRTPNGNGLVRQHYEQFQRITQP